MKFLFVSSSAKTLFKNKWRRTQVNVKQWYNIDCLLNATLHTGQEFGCNCSDLSGWLDWTCWIIPFLLDHIILSFTPVAIKNKNPCESLLLTMFVFLMFALCGTLEYSQFGSSWLTQQQRFKAFYLISKPFILDYLCIINVQEMIK